MKLIYVAQRRLESPPGAGEQAPAHAAQPHGGPGGGRRRRRRRGGGGGGRGLAARDYFREAVAYFRLEASARGMASDAWDAWESLLPQAPPVREVLPFRRRAEEALAQGPHEHVDEERQPTPEEIAAVNSLPEDEEFHGRRRRRGGRLSENARERDRMEHTKPGESGGVPEPPKPVLGEDGLPVPKRKKPDRKRPLAAQPPPQAVVAPPPPPAPKLPPSERIARAMASENGHPLINPYTGKAYVPRKVFDEVPIAAPLTADASGGVSASAAVSEATPAGGYTLDEFEEVGEPEAEAALLPSSRESSRDSSRDSSREEKRPEKRERGEKRSDAGRSQPSQQAGSQASGAAGQPGGEGRRKRRRRGRRGRGRGGNRPGGGGGGGNSGGGNGGGGSAPPAGGAPPAST